MTAARKPFDDDLRTILDAFRQIIQALRSGAHQIESRVGLTSAQLFALQQLAASPGASVNELAARTFTHQSSVSMVVKRLADRRLVAKRTSPRDRRRVALHVTEAGQRLLDRAPEPAQDRLIAGVRALGEADRRTLAAALADVAAAMTRSTAPPPMFFEEDARATRPPSAPPRRRARRAAATRPA